MTKSENSLSIEDNDSKKYRKLASLFNKIITNDKLLWIGSPVFILVLWEVIARSGLVPPLILPAPTAILQKLFKLLVSGDLFPHIYISLFRALSGFVAGSLLGILLGLMVGWSKWVNNVVDIPFNVLRTLPISALVPLSIVWFGIGEFPKVLLISTVPFVTCTVNTIAGVKGVDIVIIKAARSLGAKDKDILREIIVPASMPMIFAALRLGIVVSLVLLVVVEITAAEKGLGAFIMETQRLFYTTDMFAGIIVLAATGYILDRIVRMAEARVLRWHKGIATAANK